MKFGKALYKLDLSLKCCISGYIALLLHHIYYKNKKIDNKK